VLQASELLQQTGLKTIIDANNSLSESEP